MKYLFFILPLFFSLSCQLKKKYSSLEISENLSKHYWRITKVTDNFYGEPNYYSNELISVKGKPAIKGKSLGPFEITLSFNKDSTYSESKGYFENLPDKFSRKWKINKNTLSIPTDLPKNNYDTKPVLYGQLQVIQCYDSLVILKRKIDKTKWTRIFVLEK